MSSTISKSDLTDKIKCKFFQAVAISILLYGCTTQTLRKTLGKKSKIRSTQKCWILFWTNPQTSTTQHGYCTATYCQSKTDRPGSAWKQGQTSDISLLTWTHEHTNVHQPVNSSELCGHLMPTRRFSKSNGQ